MVERLKVSGSRGLSARNYWVDVWHLRCRVPWAYY